MVTFNYQGNELSLFALATHWKNYWSHFVTPYLIGDVLEVGAGIGTNTLLLRSDQQKSWVCLEPDPKLSAQSQSDLRNLGFSLQFRMGTLDSITSSFDTILYLDVLEHIKEDAEELKKAATRLKPGGALIILSPAHQWLFSPFDAAVGHHRRYTKKTLSRILPEELKIDRLIYLDSIGLSASLTNRLFLRKSIPSETNIRTWDGFLVPISRVIDPLLGYQFGKSVLCILRKPD